MKCTGWMIWSLILTIILVGGVIFSAKTRAEYNADKKVWEEESARLEARIEESSRIAEEEREKALEAEARADVWRDKAVETERLLANERADFARRIAEVATLAPDQLVIAHHFHLETDSTHVWLNSFGLQFTLEASRQNLTLLEERRFYIKTEKPRLEQIITEHKGEVRELRVANRGFKNSMDAMGQEITDWKARYSGEHDLRLKAEKALGFKLFSVETAVGGAVGVVLGVVLIWIF